MNHLKNPSWKKWDLYPVSEFINHPILQELGISPLTAQVLSNRGIPDAEQARLFLFPSLSDLPDPFLMLDIDKAIGRIVKAVRAQEKITLFGDYDVDGTTATAILLLFLQGAGARVDFYLPHRLKEGYGLNIEALKKIRSRGASLLITLDCGISNVEEIRWAQENGLDVIVTDHHEVPEILPPALAILNPKQKNCSYPFKVLAGVGVAFNLIIALRSIWRQEGFWKNDKIPNLKEYLDLVALGTVSDAVPLLGVNRILTKYGLSQLTHSARPGLLALKEAAGIGGVAVDTVGVNFRLAPRINAAGRMADAQEAVRLFISKDEREAREIAAHLEDLNALRQRTEEKILKEAKEIILSSEMDRKQNSFVLSSPGWHPGVIGIVASRLAEEYHRPTILIALNENFGKGSGRSIEAFPLYQGLKACQNWVERFGGHEQAAGLVIRRECIPDFSKAFEGVVTAGLSQENFIPHLSIDAMATLGCLDETFLADLDTLSPFGPGNPEPILGLEDLTVLDSRIVGKGHLRLQIQNGEFKRDAIGFRMASLHPLNQKRIRMAFSPQVEIYRGRRNLQLRIIDLQPLM